LYYYYVIRKVINNDGSIYKYDPILKSIAWHTSLKMDLLTFSMNDTQTDSYFLPNFDGNFIFVSPQKSAIVLLFIISRKSIKRNYKICLIYALMMNRNTICMIQPHFMFWILLKEI
jgi:hypothetical protein